MKLTEIRIAMRTTDVIAKPRKHCKLRRKCDKCSLKFYSHFCLLLHLRVHIKTSSSGWFTCQNCNKRFHELRNAVKHRQRHITVKRHHSPTEKDASMFVRAKSLTKDSCEEKGENFKQTRPHGKTAEKDSPNHVAFKFIEQLKAALCLDTDEKHQDNGRSLTSDLQISEVSSSNEGNSILKDHNYTDVQSLDNLKSIVLNETKMIESSSDSKIITCTSKSDLQNSVNDDECVFSIMNQGDKLFHITSSIENQYTSLRDGVIGTGDLSENSQVCDAEVDVKDKCTWNNAEESVQRAAITSQISSTTNTTELKQEKQQRKASKSDVKVEHKPDRKYGCCYCKARFVCLSRLRRHKRIVHKKNKKINGSKILKVNRKNLVEKGFDGATITPETNEGIENNIMPVNKQQLSDNCTFFDIQSIGNNNFDDPVDESKFEIYNLDGSEKKYIRNSSFQTMHHISKVDSDILASGKSIKNSLHSCELCKATFLTAYWKNQHLLKRHSTANLKTVMKENETENGASKLFVVADDAVSNSKAENDLSTACTLCNIDFETIKQQRNHTLHFHGLEVTFENAAFVFKTEDLPQLQAEQLGLMNKESSTDSPIHEEGVYYGVRDNYCKICKISFARLANLRRHMQNKHDITVRKGVIRRKKRNGSKLSLELDECVSYAQSCDGKEKLTQMEKGFLEDKIRYRNGKDIHKSFKITEHANAEHTNANYERIHENRKDGNSPAVFKDENSYVFWKADFLAKSFTCFACDFDFSGFFILRKHMARNHAICLDLHGKKLCNSNCEYPIPAMKDHSSMNNVNSTAIHQQTLHVEDKLKSSKGAVEAVYRISNEEDNEANYLQKESKAPVIEDNSIVDKNANGMYQCPKCSMKFDNLIDRYIHIVDNHNKKLFHQKREFKKSKKNKMQTHYQGESLSFPQKSNHREILKCVICGSTFESIKDWKKHLRTMHKLLYANMFKDANRLEGTCDKKMSQITKQVNQQSGQHNEAILKKKETHNATRESNTDHTTKLMNSNGPIVAATDQMTVPKKSLFTCEQCHVEFTNWKDQREHLQAVHNLKIKMNTAKKSFPIHKNNQSIKKTSNALSIQIGASDNERAGTEYCSNKNSFTANNVVANAPFVRQSDTTVSIDKSKEGKKPRDQDLFQCSECGRGYSSTGNLRKHIRLNHFSNNSKSSIHEDNYENACKQQPNKDYYHTEKTNIEQLLVQANATDVAVKMRPDKEIVIERIESTEEEDFRQSLYRRSRGKKSLSTLEDSKEHDKTYCTITTGHSVNENKSYVETSIEEAKITNVSYHCELCNVVFKYAHQLKQHQMYGACSHQIVCKIHGCGKAFQSESSYREHVKHTCTICHSQLASDRHLKRHYRCVHKINQTLSCDLCGELFDDPISLAVHNKENHLQG